MVVWKWTLKVKDVQTLRMPVGAKFLAIQSQYGSAQLWALVDENAPVEDRTFHIFGTGVPIDNDDPGAYIGTYQVDDGALVFHVFERRTYESGQ